jgi:phage portal protein BeeE
MALVELTQTNNAGIAVLLGVPPFLVGLPSGGDSMTYSNVSSLFDYHWRAGLRPKAATVCAALSGWALPRGTGLEVNRDEYVRPDPKTRAETWAILIGAGILAAEEARAFERFGLGAPVPVLKAVNNE